MAEHQTPEREVGDSKPTSVVSLSKILFSPKVLVIHRKRWLRPDMTEKLLIGTLSSTKTNKNLFMLTQTNHYSVQL